MGNRQGPNTRVATCQVHAPAVTLVALTVCASQSCHHNTVSFMVPSRSRRNEQSPVESGPFARGSRCCTTNASNAADGMGHARSSRQERSPCQSPGDGVSRAVVKFSPGRHHLDKATRCCSFCDYSQTRFTLRKASRESSRIGGCRVGRRGVEVYGSSNGEETHISEPFSSGAASIGAMQSAYSRTLQQSTQTNQTVLNFLPNCVIITDRRLILPLLLNA
ncbi:hypothetical protein K431DRAFT_113800 [Polychaeton citri CBS 116435]|uniref:Uncharacterized protein n=1 Tax=Polychaeton citri CBS 116435 TaxID=1314669 RepID=A0A9P4Q485_9PEZI|nr:hypothetical protein K431DRAFT_113800 [Polychaeton citri CBS 116435]